MQLFKYSAKQHTTTEMGFEESTTTNEIAELLAQSDVNDKYYLLNDNNKFINLSHLLSEVPLTKLDPLFVNLNTTLSDELVEGYSTDQPPFGNKVLRVEDGLCMSHITIELTDINNPSKRAPVSIGTSSNLDDIVISGIIDTKNFIVAIGGYIVPMVYFEDEVFIPGGAKLFRESSTITIMDSSPIGGHTYVPTNNLSLKLHHSSKRLFFILPVDVSLKGDNAFVPMISICGQLHVFDEFYRVENDHTVSIDLNLIPDDIIYQLLSTDAFIHIVTDLSVEEKAEAIANHPATALFLFHRPISKEIFLLEEAAKDKWYLYKRASESIHGICMSAYKNKILSYKHLFSEFRDTDTRFQTIMINENDHMCNSVEYDINQDWLFKIEQPLVSNKNIKNDIMMIQLSSR